MEKVKRIIIFFIIMIIILILIYMVLSSCESYNDIKTYNGLTLRYMWGLWDNTPLPQKYVKQQDKNQDILKGSKKNTYLKKDIEELVLKYSNEFDNDFYNIYNSIKRNVTKADIGRYLLIYYYGGVYIDNDIDILSQFSMNDLKTYKNGVWYTEHIANIQDLGPKEEKNPVRIANYIIASLYPKNEILLDIIKESSKRIKSLQSQEYWNDSDVLWCAGPDVVTTILTHTQKRDYILYDLEKSKNIILHKSEGTWRLKKDK